MESTSAQKPASTFIRLPSNVEVTYVSQKIKKVRWIPDESENNKFFITGVVDNVKHPFHVWTFQKYAGDEEGRDYEEFSTFSINGYITKFKFIDKNNIVLYLSYGDPRVVQIGEHEVSLFVGNGLQNYQVNFGDDCAEYGQDGWIYIQSNLLSAAKSALNTICRVKSNEVIFGPVHGRMKIENICTTPSSLLNAIKVWNFQFYAGDFRMYYPRELSWYYTKGHVTEMKYTEKFTVAVSTSDGTVRLLSIKPDDKQAPLITLHTWKRLHNLGERSCSCTALDTKDGHIATVGQDGSLKVLSCESGDVTRNIEDADRGVFHSICYIDQNEIVTGNDAGKLEMWDIRSPDNKPVSTFEFTDTEAPVTSIVLHPLQPRFAVAGSETGAVGTWDLRASSSPTILLKAHAAAVTEMHFHPDNLKKLITISRSSELFDWNTGDLMKGSDGADTWLPLTNQDDMKVKAVLPKRPNKPLNSFDCDKDRVLVGGEDEAFYDIKQYEYAD